MDISKKTLVRVGFVAVLLVLGVIFFVVSMPDPKQAAFCAQYDGFYSFAGNPNDIPQCAQKGCRVVKGRYQDDPKTFDDEGYYYKCFPKTRFNSSSDELRPSPLR